MKTLLKDYGHSKFEIEEMLESIYRRTKEENITFLDFRTSYNEYAEQCKIKNKEYNPFHIWGLQRFGMLVYEHAYKTKEEQTELLALYEKFLKRFGKSELFFQSFMVSYEAHQKEKRKKDEFMQPFFVYVIHLCELFGIGLK